MSLINDALKRARQQQKERPGPPPAGLPLQPVENRGNGGSLLRVVYPVLLLVTLGLGSFFLWKWYESRGASNRGPEVAVTRPASPPPEPTPAPSPTPSLAQAPLVQTPVRPVVLVNTTLVTRSQGLRPGVSASPGVEGQPAAAPASPPVAVAPAAVPASPPPVDAQAAPLPAVVPPAVPVAAAEAPKPKEFKLQAIFFRLRNPTVLINDQTVGVGATVNGAKIAKIERESVSLLVDGETRVLHLR